MPTRNKQRKLARNRIASAYRHLDHVIILILQVADQFEANKHNTEAKALRNAARMCFTVSAFLDDFYKAYLGSEMPK